MVTHLSNKKLNIGMFIGMPNNNITKSNCHFSHAAEKYKLFSDALQDAEIWHHRPIM